MAAGPPVWLRDGIRVEHDGQEFAINDADRTIIILNIGRSRFANRGIPFQCCVELETRRRQVCGERYFIDPLGKAQVHLLWRYFYLLMLFIA